MISMIKLLRVLVSVPVQVGMLDEKNHKYFLNLEQIKKEKKL